MVCNLVFFLNFQKQPGAIMYLEPAFAELEKIRCENLASENQNMADWEYSRIALNVLQTGTLRGNRTDKRALSAFGNSMDFDIEDNLALISTKKLPLRYIVGELLWFISGSSDVALLNEISSVPKDKNGIWDEWALSRNYYQEVVRDVSAMVTEIAVNEGRKETVINQELVIYQEKFGLDGITKYMAEHGVPVKQKIQVGRKGHIGPLYGHQWRRRQTEAYIDQLDWLINGLQNDPLDRRHLLVSWDPDKLPRPDMNMDENILVDKQPIAPCHWASQYYAEPILTDANTPLRTLVTDNNGCGKFYVPKKFLGESFRIFNEDLNEYIGDFNTEEYSLSITTGDNAEVIRKQTESSIKYGVTVENDFVALNGLSQECGYQLHSFAGLPVTMQGGKVSGMLHMRSSDVFLGLPFNISSYALLCHLMGREMGAKANRLFVTLGDYHIYENHLEQIQEQLTRTTFKQPKFVLSDDVPSIRQIMQMANSPIRLKEAVDAIVACVEGYQSHPSIKGEVAV